MNRQKIIIATAASLLFVGILLCGFAVFSNKKDSSDDPVIESVTFDTEPVSVDSDTPHTFTRGDADEQNASPEDTSVLPVTSDEIPEESVSEVPIDDTSEEGSLPSHSFAPGTP